MDPLAVVEEKLGSVDSWPTSVIMYMFYEEPNVSYSRKFAAFMYGNGVSVSDGVKLYKACQAAWRNVSEANIYGWDMQCAKCSASTLFSYNMKKYVMWLGRDERVEPEVIVRNFGPARSS